MYKKIGFFIIDLIRGTKVLKVLSELKSKQYMPLDELVVESKLLMEAHFKLVREITPYYRNNKSYEHINKLPYLKKETVIEDTDLFISEQIKTSTIIKKRTGGSTGTPFTYYTSTKSQSYLWAGILLSWSASGYRVGDKVGMLAGSSLFKQDNFKQRMYYRLMNIHLMDANTLNSETCDVYAKSIIRNKTKFIYGYTSALFELAKFIISSGLDIRVKAVITTSEVLTLNMRSTIEKAFNCSVFDQYGCNDAGVAAFECEIHNGLHLNILRSYVAVDDKGCLHATDMTNDIMPLLNFSTGDLVELSDEECLCGRGFPLLKGVDGRTNDIIKTPAGHILHSSFFNKLFSIEKKIQTYQATYRNKQLHVNIIVLEGGSINTDAFEAAIKQKLSDTPVYFNFNEAIVKLQNGKMKNLIVGN